MAHTLDDLREIVTKEIDEINKKGELDENSLVCVYKLVDILKDIGEIEGQEMGYSCRYMGYPYMMDDGNSYRGGYSNRYSNTGYSMRNRDSMGRYSRDYSPNSYRGGYSRDGERDEIMAKMEHMMNTAGSETERQVIQRIMSQM